MAVIVKGLQSNVTIVSLGLPGRGSREWWRHREPIPTILRANRVYQRYTKAGNPPISHESWPWMLSLISGHAEATRRVLLANYANYDGFVGVAQGFLKTRITAHLAGRSGIALFGNKNPKWYPCVVKMDNKDGTIKVQWDGDKKFTKRLPVGKFRLNAAVFSKDSEEDGDYNCTEGTPPE